MKNTVLKFIEVKMVRLTEILKLKLMLGGDYRGGDTAKAAVVDSSDGSVVVRKFGANFGVGDEGKSFELFGDVRDGIVAVEVVVVVVFVIVRGHWGVEMEN